MYKLSCSSSSSTDEDDGDFRRPKLYRESNNYFELYEDDQFFVNFRLSKKVVRFLLAKIEHLIKVPHQRLLFRGRIKPMHQLLITLRFYALGNVLKTIGDFAGVSRPSACRIIKRVSKAIVSLKAKYIKMPESQLEMEKAAQNFHRISQISNVIGSMDCTYIRTKFPGVVDDDSFKTKNGCSALKVQGISDGHLKFIDIAAAYTKDQTIFSTSKLKEEFESGKYGQYILVGNGCYESEKYLLVEHDRESQIEGESECRKGWSAARNVVVTMFSEWKKRFPILSSGMRFDMETTMIVINATAVLHNIAKEMKDHLPVNWYQGVILDADQIRQKIIDEHILKSK